MREVIEDLSVITTIPKNSLKRLIEKSKFIICHDIKETLIEKKTDTVIDIGIGVLTIHIEDDTIKYRFEPAPSFEDAIIHTVETGENPLTYELESSLVTRITKAQKDLF